MNCFQGSLGRPPFFGDSGLLVLSGILVQLLCSHILYQTNIYGGNTPGYETAAPNEPGVNTASDYIEKKTFFRSSQSGRLCSGWTQIWICKQSVRSSLPLCKLTLIGGFLISLLISTSFLSPMLFAFDFRWCADKAHCVNDSCTQINGISQKSLTCGGRATLIRFASRLSKDNGLNVGWEY